jgi:hypothetical protein
MKNRILCLSIINTMIFFLSACNSASIQDNALQSSLSQETLYVYEDGKMKLNSRYVDSENVIIYSDGRGGEKAAVIVHFPVRSNFYRDSIVVVRVDEKSEESLAQQ